jgi:pimeloyl-ACP methyl ester carboxylesterase
MIEECRYDLAHGITLACCRVAGPTPDAPRVLLLHGFPQAAFVWDEVLDMLAPHAHGLAPNLRGYPGSSSPAETSAYRAKLLVQDVAALIEAFTGNGARPLDLLVAHDWGGALAWNLAAQQPQLMRRLLILNAPHPATFLRELRHSAEQQAASAYMSRLCQADAEAVLAADDHAALLDFFGAAPWLTPALKARHRAAWTHPGGGLRGPLNYYRASPLRPALGAGDALNTLDLPDDAVTVRVPTTVLWGEQDHALRPGLLQGLERWVPQLQVQRVPQASHWIVHEQPALVAAVVRSLLPGHAA